MEFVKKIVDSDILNDIITLPEALKNRKVEVIILPLDETEKINAKPQSRFGALSKYANPELIPLEVSAFEKAMAEKHENR